MNRRLIQGSEKMAQDHLVTLTAGRLTLDLNAEVQLRRNLLLYATAQNVFNHYDTWQRYGPDTPDYAKNYETRGNGVQIMLGVKGTF